MSRGRLGEIRDQEGLRLIMSITSENVDNEWEKIRRIEGSSLHNIESKEGILTREALIPIQRPLNLASEGF